MDVYERLKLATSNFFNLPLTNTMDEEKIKIRLKALIKRRHIVKCVSC